MPGYNSDPRLSLYDTTADVFGQIKSELNAYDVVYLSVLAGHAKRRPFHDNISRFEADEFELSSVEYREPASFGIGVELFRNGIEYVRQADLVGPFKEEIPSSPNSHLVVVTDDGPPALMHNDYFGSVHNTINDVPALIAAGYAEVLSFDRAAYIKRALSELAAGQIDPEWLV